MRRILLKIEVFKLSSLQCQEVTCQDVSWAIWDLFHISFSDLDTKLGPHTRVSRQHLFPVRNTFSKKIITVLVCYQCRHNDVCLIKLPVCP